MRILSSGVGVFRNMRMLVRPELWVKELTLWNGGEPLTNTPLLPAPWLSLSDTDVPVVELIKRIWFFHADSLPTSYKVSAISPWFWRSEERRVGKECRSRGSRYHYKKKEKEG